MSGMLGHELARKQRYSGHGATAAGVAFAPALSGILALGSTIALPLSALSQATPAENAPAIRRAPLKKAVAAPVPEPAPPPQPTVAPSLFEQPPVPATVTSQANELTVKADNSSLSQILHQVSSATGMRLDGLGGDERVFGSFGPGAPREVLTALLNGTSYNVVMVGDLPNGAPRELLLSHRAAGGSSPQTCSQRQSESGSSAITETRTIRTIAQTVTIRRMTLRRRCSTRRPPLRLLRRRRRAHRAPQVEHLRRQTRLNA